MRVPWPAYAYTFQTMSHEVVRAGTDGIWAYAPAPSFPCRCDDASSGRVATALCRVALARAVLGCHRASLADAVVVVWSLRSGVAAYELHHSTPLQTIGTTSSEPLGQEDEQMHVVSLAQRYISAWSIAPTLLAVQAAPRYFRPEVHLEVNPRAVHLVDELA